MIKYFEVEGYKNFKNIVSLDFSDVRDYKFNSNCVKDKKLNNIIIYGKNAVGKTNLGTALMDIKDNFVRIPNFLILDQNYINADSNKKEARFKYIFEIDNNEIVYEYKKGEDARLILETLEINQNHIFTYNHISKKKNLGNIELINASTLNWETLENNVSILNYIVNNIPLDESNILKKLYEFISGMSFISGNNLLENKNNIYIEDIIEKNQVKELEKFLNKFDINEKLELKTTKINSIDKGDYKFLADWNRDGIIKMLELDLMDFTFENNQVVVKEISRAEFANIIYKLINSLN